VTLCADDARLVALTMVRWILFACSPINAVQVVVCAVQLSAESAVAPYRGSQDRCVRVAESRSRGRLFAVLSAVA